MPCRQVLSGAPVVARGAAWRIPKRLVLAAPWDQQWQAGSWVQHRTGQGAKAVALRSNMTAEQRRRLQALPYGR